MNNRYTYNLNASEPQEIAFIDTALPYWQILKAGIADHVRAFLLDAIHIYSHDSVGQLQLGGTYLNLENITGNELNNLSQYQPELAQIANSLTESGDLLLYGCNVAQGAAGQGFIQQLAMPIGTVESSLTLRPARSTSIGILTADGIVNANLRDDSNP